MVQSHLAGFAKVNTIARHLPVLLVFAFTAQQPVQAEQTPVIPAVSVAPTSALTPESSIRESTTSQLSVAGATNDTAPPATGLRYCFEEIDRAALSFENGRADLARTHLQLLMQSCSDVPQLHHNLGALALLERKWDDAIIHFEQSLALDERAAMTQQTLASVYQYKAALAYKKALNLTGENPKLPTVKMQSSGLRNSPDLNSLTGLGTVAPSHKPAPIHDSAQAVREAQFDMANWWRAQRLYDMTAYFSYYYPGMYPGKFGSAELWHAHWAAMRTRNQEASNHVPLPAWEEVQFNAEPLDEYLLVNLRFQSNPDTIDATAPEADKRHTQIMLVLLKTGQTWQIIKERSW